MIDPRYILEIKHPGLGHGLGAEDQEERKSRIRWPLY